MENEEISLTKQNYDRWRIILESSDLNSIELSRLFANLRIEAPDNFAMPLPPAHAKNSPMNYQPFNSRIVDITNINNENYERIEMHQGEESWEYKTCLSFSHNKKKATPFKIPNVDILFPSEIPLPSTPLNELYPFR